MCIERFKNTAQLLVTRNYSSLKSGQIHKRIKVKRNYGAIISKLLIYSVGSYNHCRLHAVFLDIKPNTSPSLITEEQPSTCAEINAILELLAIKLQSAERPIFRTAVIDFASRCTYTEYSYFYCLSCIFVYFLRFS